MDMETPEHLSFYCPRLMRARVDIFHTFYGEPEKWSVGQVLRFIKTTGCKDLLIDHNDYTP